MLKGVPADDLERLGEVVRRVWCDRVRAKPEAQFVGTVNEAGGLMRYLALHFQKESQSPPKGWRGHRFLHSRGYFEMGIAETRERAREQLRYRREVWRIEQAAPEMPADLVDELARAALERADAIDWKLEVVDQAEQPPATDVELFRQRVGGAWTWEFGKPETRVVKKAGAGS